MTRENAMDPARIGLALSGGGIRAAVFHLGFLKRLAEARLLEDVSQISSVSGGSLVTGAIFSLAGGRWPTSEEFINETYPELRAILTSRDLFSFNALGFKGVFRHNIRIARHRAKILSDLLSRQWGIKLSLTDLPEYPKWHINTTCLETGKNWRFTRYSMGDWKFGTHYSPNIRLSDAMAASAAVPYVIGALCLRLPESGWWETDPATKRPIRRINRPEKVRLWDGGVYENMGLEPLFKPSKGLIECDTLFCSDASGPLGTHASPLRKLFSGTLPSPRLMDISGDQIRGLRSRMLIHSVRSGNVDAFVIRMGTLVRQKSMSIPTSDGLLTDEQCVACWKYPTDLKRMAKEHFDLIARHGFEVTEVTLNAYSGGRFVSKP